MRPFRLVLLPKFALFSILLAVSGVGSAGSNTWTGGHPGLAAPATTMIATDPSNPYVVYAAFDLDLYRSADGGRSWKRLRSFDEYRYNHVLSLFVSPASPSTVFVGLETGLLRSADGGESWTRALDTAVTAMTAQPSDPSVLYAGSAYGTVSRGPADGASWTEAGRIGFSALHAIASLLFGDRDDGRLYAAGGYDLLTALDYGYGVGWTLMLAKSADLGATWTDVAEAFPSEDHLYVKDLVAGASAHELFAVMGNAASSLRLAHSTDGGVSWDRGYLRNLASDVELLRLVADPRRAGTLYAATTRGVYRSTDNGRAWLPFGQSIRDREVSSLALSGRSLHAGTRDGAFDLELREGAVDVSAGPAGTRLLTWNADRFSVRTLPPSGYPSETPPAGPFAPWSAVAIADGGDGLSRVLWVRGDGLAGLELIGSSGSQGVFRFAAQPLLASAADVAVGPDGSAHLLWTRPDGSMFLSRVDSAGAMTIGPDYGPYAGWTAVALADSADGSSWVLWRATDGRFGVARHRALAVETASRFEASPDGAAEDIAVGADGRPRVLRISPNGFSAVATVDSRGDLTSSQIHGKAGFAPRRIAAGPDGLTRLLWGDTDDRTEVWLLRPDNTLAPPTPTPGTPTPTPTPTPRPTYAPLDLSGDWKGTIEGGPCEATQQISVRLIHVGSKIYGSLNARCGSSGPVELKGTLSLFELWMNDQAVCILSGVAITPTTIELWSRSSNECVGLKLSLRRY